MLYPAVVSSPIGKGEGQRQMRNTGYHAVLPSASTKGLLFPGQAARQWLLAREGYEGRTSARMHDMRIYASHDGGSGCAWYRMLVPLTAVDKYAEDVDVIFRSGGPRLMKTEHEPLLLTDAADADVLVSQRADSFEGLGIWRRWSTPSCRTVYENDDDIWNITPENAKAYKSYEIGGTSREAVLRYCSTANLVTTSSAYLGDWHRELTPLTPVVVLPNYIPEFVLDLKHDDRQGRPRIGWMGGASHARDILMAANAVRRFMKRFGDWDLFLSGVDYRRQFGCPPGRSFYVEWIHVSDYPDVFYRAIDYDIGICPLLDTQFSRSKSHVKALEYMARGIPVIASDVEPYRRFITHGVDGFLVRREHEWLSALSELAGDESLRLKMGEAAKEKARKNTIEGHYREWVNAYKMLFPVGWEYKG
jgi:glycosyltransferase involved in cell wall biosynthesis